MNARRLRPSPGFVCVLGGVAISLLAWWGPWAWPAWPTVVATDLVFSERRSFSDLGFNAKATVIVILIALNIGIWAVLLRVGWALVRWTTWRSGDEK